MIELPETVLFATQKGGNGKTTTVANLGVAIARTGRKVLVIDADQQGNLTVDDLRFPKTSRTRAGTSPSSCNTAWAVG